MQKAMMKKDANEQNKVSLRAAIFIFTSGTNSFYSSTKINAALRATEILPPLC